MPETAFAGTAQEADSAQLPQSMSPVARVVQAGGLILGQARRRLDRGDLAGAVAPVVAHPVDVEAVVGRVGVHLEVDGLAVVDADVGGEPLDVRVARSVDVPFARRVPGLGVLADDRVLDRRVARGRHGGAGVEDERDKRERYREQQAHGQRPHPRTTLFELLVHAFLPPGAVRPGRRAYVPCTPRDKPLPSLGKQVP